MAADDIDRANEHAEKELAAALEAQRLEFLGQHYTRRPAPRGYCLNPDCLEDFPQDTDRLFCGSKCADAHARLTRR